MSRRRGFLTSMKEQVGRTCRSDAFIYKLHGRCMTQEKLPPRLNLRGISLAARVVSHEIRDFAKKTTGKDLVELRDSKMRNKALKKISTIKGAIESPDTKNNLLTLAYNHSTNFTKSLSPDGVECIDIDYGYKINEPSSLVARFHKQCKKEEQRFPKLKNDGKKTSLLVESKPEINPPKFCKCNSNNLQVKDGLCYLSCWEHKGIKEDDLNSFFSENLPYLKKSGLLQQIEHELIDQYGWNEFLRNDKCKVLRKQLPCGIYEYRVQASFNDISAKNLYRTQMDGDYRKKWDDYIIDLKVVDKHPETSSELVHWVTKCPYPFATREYIYLRRHKIDVENRAMILYQQATDKTNIPNTPKITRVDKYLSKIIIKPHSEDFDQNGCDFILSYYDDPKMILPTRIIDMASSRGIADSVNRMHKAALELETDAEGNS